MPTNNALLDLVAPSISVSTDHLVRHACLSNSFFELIVFPTEQCNFRCTYCYEDFAIGNMKPAIINGICRLLERRTPTLDKLKISYFGGEPLLNMRAIREISGAAIRLEAEHGFEFVSNATTNAYLLDASHLEELVSLKCNAFQISLDGWADVHDQTRQRRNGSGSFERLWSNLLAIQKTDLSFMVILRVHMTPENAHSLVELVENINRYLDDDRFLIVFKKVGNWGGTNKEHPDTFDRNPAAALALHQKLLDTAKRVYDFGIDETGGNAAPSDTAKVVNNTARLGIPPICYAARANSLAIRANGRINKCTVALKSTANDIGSIDENGDLQIDAAKLAPWLGGVSTMDGDLLRCPASRIAF